MGMTLENGYKMQTTFYEDFCIADAFGYQAVKDTYKNAFNSWKHNHVYMTELSMVLNWKMFQYYQSNNIMYDTYRALYEEIDVWCMNHLKGDELVFYIKTTD
jgi:hypothetical protein